jgi:8-oxo-dGTP diphosphatase
MTNHDPMHIVATGGFVTNSEGQVLLIKSPRYGDWEFPGGQVEEGETIPHALEREVFEETGIVIRVKSLVGIYSNTRKPSIVNIDFTCEYLSGEPQTSAEALARVKREVIYKRLKNMLEFSGKITYQAYFVDPNCSDLKYKELEERKI